MSENELIRKYYYGSYQINSKGHLMCPLYDEEKSEDTQSCNFYIQSQGVDLTGEEFLFVWTHVKDFHPNTYQEILQMCQKRILNISKDTQGEKIYDLIGSTSVNLNKLTTSWLLNNINSSAFLTQFKTELESLEKKVSDLLTSMIQANPNSNNTSMMNL